MKSGIAKSLAGPGWFGSSKAGTSANAIFDPDGGIEMVKPTNRAWHVGGGNDYTYGTEHAGRAAFTAAQWLTDPGKVMLTASARWNRQIADTYSIPWRRLSVAEIKAGQRGLCTHNDCRLVWGGTTHTDPQWADEVWDFYLAAGSGSSAPTQTDQEDEFMGYINNQADFNKAMKAWATAQPDQGFRAALDIYFDSRIPDAAKPSPGSISERLGSRIFNIFNDSTATRPNSLAHIVSKLNAALGRKK